MKTSLTSSMVAAVLSFCVCPDVSGGVEKGKVHPAPQGANTLTAEEKSQGWKLLWDGTANLDQWLSVRSKCRETPKKGWMVREPNVLTVMPKCKIVNGQRVGIPPDETKLGGGGDIVTKEFFGDFAFKFDFRLTDGCNSGVKYFYDETQNGGTCEEYQILDKGHPDQNHGRDGNHRVASLYDIIPADAEKIVRKPGEWNHGEIISRGRIVQHWLNGVKVVEYERGSEEFRRLVARSKYARSGRDRSGKRQPWGELATGRILLQDHEDSAVSYCNLKIRRLKSVPDAKRTLTVSPGGLSPQAAADRIKAARAAGDASPWAVYVKKGSYRFEKPLEMDASHSDVSWIGEDGVSFSAGRPVTEWKDTGKGWWEAPVPRKADGKPAYFEMLWVNGRRADRARYPNGRRCLPIKGSKQIPVVRNGVKMFAETVCFSNGVLKAIGNIPEEELGSAQICAAVNWMFGRRILEGLDVAKDEVYAGSRDNWGGWKNWVTANTLVWFENVRSAFDVPGEWFYDAPAGKILYRPLPGESVSSVSAVAPAENTRLIVLRGNPGSGVSVKNVVFRNLVFEHTDAMGYFGETGRPTQWHQYQAAIRSDAAVVLVGARDCRFENCTVRHTGNYGMRFYDGCRHNTVTDCTLEDLGAGGIMMGSEKPHVAEGEKLTRRIIRNLAPRSVAFNVVSNCTIRHIGLFIPEGTGVALTHASDCKVLHCDIYDGYYSGVSVGWSWGFGGSVAQRNEIAFNRISDLGHGVMSDMGGVYTLGTSFGTHVHDNVIHDIRSRFYGAWALYADEGSEGVVFERNLCWNTTDGGFVMHYGVDSIVRNNIFAWVKKIGHVRMSRDIVHDIPCSLHFYRNIIISDGTELVAKGVGKVGGIWAANLWWDVSGKPVFDGGDWKSWTASGKEINGVYADPGFEDARKLDFRLKKDSPAFALGFKSWDFSRAGRKTGN